MDRRQGRSFKLQGISALLFGLLSSCHGFRQISRQNRPQPGEIGCFKDSPLGSDLPFAVIREANAMTKKLCIMSCEEAWYNYAAVQNGDTCWCGNDYGKYGKVDLSECQIRCTGDEKETCGGPLRNFIMYTGYVIDNRGDIDKCWLVSKSNCITMKYQGALKSREQCRSYCGTFRKKFAAVTEGNVCYCGDFFFGTLLRETKACKKPCLGNQSEICGGSDDQMFIMSSFRDENDLGLLLVQGCYFETPIPTLLKAKKVSLDENALKSGNGKVSSPSADEMKRKLCQQKCKQRRFKLAGVKDRVECWCSNTFNGNALLTDDDRCSRPCDEKRDKWCSSSSSFMFVTDSGLEGQKPILMNVHYRHHDRHSCD